MTQKELSYVEDAISHEDNIIKIINESLNMAEDERIISFLEKEKDNHEEMHKKLINLLEDKANE